MTINTTINTMTSSKIDISVIIPAHSEGRLAQHTLNSVFRAVSHADASGITAEIIVVMDRPDEKTQYFFAQYPESAFHRTTTDFGDAGLARNHGVQMASGHYVAFLDADNLICGNWLTTALESADKLGTDAVFHPEYVVVFGEQNIVWHVASSGDPECVPENMIEFNYWDTVCLANRQIMCDFPYHPTLATEGFGHEDWHFNCETLVAGIPHLTVPKTVYFMRRKNKSVSSFATQTNRIIPPTHLFDVEKFIS